MSVFHLANFKIGKQLGLVFGGVVLLIIFSGAMSIWFVYDLQSSAKASQLESRQMMLADRVSADQGAIARRIGTMTVARHAGKEILEQTVVPSFNELSGSIENCVNYAREIWRDSISKRKISSRQFR